MSMMPETEGHRLSIISSPTQGHLQEQDIQAASSSPSILRAKQYNKMIQIPADDTNTLIF